MNEHTVAIEILPEELRKMQLLQLEILKEIDRICRKYQIKYTNYITLLNLTYENKCVII